MNLKDVLEVATEAGRAAVAVHRGNLGRVASEEWAEKSHHDFVTRVDREAERAVIGRIHSAFPDHRFLSEEEATAQVEVPVGSGSTAGSPGGDGAAASGSTAGPPGGDGAAGSGPTTGSPAGDGVVRHVSIPADRLGEARAENGWIWVIDPLDGTTNYLHEYPMYAVSIAGLLDGELAVGVVIDGSTGATWSATRGGGAFLDGRRIRVSETTEPSRALIGTGFPFKQLDLLPEYLEQFARITRATAGVRRAGSAALDLCHLASGYFDAFWELSLAPWDLAAGALVVREAGGVITRIDGNADIIGSGSVLASNGKLHAWLAALLLDI